MKTAKAYTFLWVTIIGVILLSTFILYQKKSFPFNKTNNDTYKEAKQLDKLAKAATLLQKFAIRNGYNTSIFFLVDFSISSGKKRFYVYEKTKNQVVSSGLVAHGSCNNVFLSNAKFSNVEGGGCSSTGRYAVAGKYNGKFGPAFKLEGLDKTNSNAYKRFVVLHAFGCVPDTEIYPMPLCNSLGCPMVSYKFLEKLQGYIEASPKPILLWILNTNSAEDQNRQVN